MFQLFLENGIFISFRVEFKYMRIKAYKKYITNNVHKENFLLEFILKIMVV